MDKLNINFIKSLLKHRKSNSHKGVFGHALLVVGNKGKMGSAIIASRACLRVGVGLLTVYIPYKERITLQATIPEAMLIMRGNNNNNNNEVSSTQFSALGIGCGIGIEKDSEDILTEFLANFKNPIVLDADALNIISINKKLFNKIPKKTILTPHAKEFDRLFGAHISNNHRIISAIKYAKKNQLIIVLKSNISLITDGEYSYLNTTGNVGLAKAGSGDALTGIITALLAQKYSPLHASILGVYIHGLAADCTLDTQSIESMLITDVIENLGKAFNKIK